MRNFASLSIAVKCFIYFTAHRRFVIPRAFFCVRDEHIYTLSAAYSRFIRFDPRYYIVVTVIGANKRGICASL